MSDQTQRNNLVLGGASLKAAVLAAENPLLKGMVRSRFFTQMGLSEVLGLDLRGIPGLLRPAVIPALPDLRAAQGGDQ